MVNLLILIIYSRLLILDKEITAVLPITKSNKLKDGKNPNMMTTPDEYKAEVIKDLLHLDLDIRKHGFKQIKENWDIKFREYLWKAIEEEKNKSFQADMVLFALNTLKSDSLRKMIRFLEKDQLHPRSRNHVISYYLDYENQLVREALVKSLKRSGHTYTFVCGLFRNQFPDTFDSNSCIQLVKDVLDEEIDIKYRREIIVEIFNKIFSNYNFKMYLSEFIWDFLIDNPFLHRIILQVFFIPDSSPKLVYAKRRYKPELIWQNWSWNLMSERDDLNYDNEYLKALTDEDLFIISSYLKGKLGKNHELIQVLSHLSVTRPPPNITETYLTPLYLVWDVIIREDLSIQLMHLESYEKTVLDQVFTEPVFEGEDSELLLSDLFVAEAINPHDVIARTMAFLPRYFLSELLQSDDKSIAHIASQTLCQKNFFEFNDSSRLIGPTEYWVNMISSILGMIQADQPKRFYDSLTRLFFLLINLLSGHSDSILVKQVNDRLKLKINTIEELKLDSFTFPVYHKIARYLELSIKDIPDECKMTSTQQIILFEDLFDPNDLSQFSELMNTIILMDNYKTQSFVLEFLTEQLELNPELDINVVRREIEVFIENLQKSTDVRIRTKAALLKQSIPKAPEKTQESENIEEPTDL